MGKAISQVLFDGDIELSRNARHQYKAKFLGSDLQDASEVSPVSVTQVTGLVDKSQALLPWAVKQMALTLERMLDDGEAITRDSIQIAKKTWRQTKEEAANLGTRVHEWIHEYMTVGQATPDSDITHIADQFRRWWESYALSGAKQVGDERLVYSPELNYAGQVDAIRQINGQYIVIDYKTSKGIYKEHMFQLAAYVQALQQEGIVDDNVSRMALHINKETGEVTPYELDRMAGKSPEYRSLKEDIDAFNSLRVVYHNLKGK